MDVIYLEECLLQLGAKGTVEFAVKQKHIMSGWYMPGNQFAGTSMC